MKAFKIFLIVTGPALLVQISYFKLSYFLPTLLLLLFAYLFFRPAEPLESRVKISAHVIGLIFALLILLYCPTHHEENDKRGAELAKELETYANKHGQYPTNLKELEDDLGRKLPKQKRGLLSKSFDYRLTTSDRYELSMQEGWTSDKWTWEGSFFAN